MQFILIMQQIFSSAFGYELNINLIFFGVWKIREGWAYPGGLNVFIFTLLGIFYMMLFLSCSLGAFLGSWNNQITHLGKVNNENPYWVELFCIGIGLSLLIFSLNILAFLPLLLAYFLAGLYCAKRWPKTSWRFWLTIPWVVVFMALLVPMLIAYNIFPSMERSILGQPSGSSEAMVFLDIKTLFLLSIFYYIISIMASFMGNYIGGRFVGAKSNKK